MTTLAQILPAGDSAALTRWLADPQADLAIPRHTEMVWGGEPDAGVGRDVCAAFARAGGWGVAEVLGYAIQRLVVCPDTERLAPLLHALLAYSHQPEAGLTARDGRSLLVEIEAWEDQRRLCCFAPIFAPLYDLLGAILPLEAAVAHLREAFLDERGDAAQIAALLAIYGPPALPALGGMLARAVDAQMQENLPTLDRRLVRLLAHGSAHKRAAFLAALDLGAARVGAPHTLVLAMRAPLGMDVPALP